tara:strand:- start:9886 stop:11019 length:1134 start_codon:yes stop_codon:yes gene_type:complete
MQFTTMPSYELGKRYSLDRPSSKYRRAARRLRRQGYRAAAQEMALQGEKIRLNEPTILTPEYRKLQRSANIPNVSSSAQAMQGSFDPTTDMADLKGSFFSDIAASNMPSQDIAGAIRQFGMRGEGSIKEQKAFIDLQTAQRKNRKEQQVQLIAPQVASRLQEISSSDAPNSVKRDALLATAMTPKIASLMGDTTIKSLFTEADANLTKKKADQDAFKSKLEDLAKAGTPTSGLDADLSQRDREIFDIIQRRESSKITRTESLKELEDIGQILFRLNTGADISDQLLENLNIALPKGTSLSASSRKEALISLIKQLKYASGTMPEDEESGLKELAVEELFNIAFKTLTLQRSALSMRFNEEISTPDPAVTEVSDSWRR